VTIGAKRTAAPKAFLTGLADTIRYLSSQFSNSALSLNENIRTVWQCVVDCTHVCV